MRYPILDKGQYQNAKRNNDLNSEYFKISYFDLSSGFWANF